MGKIRVGVLFGGKSCEHEVSLWSAKNVVEALDGEKYEPVLISIDKKGAWHMRVDPEYLMQLNEAHPQLVNLHQEDGSVAIVPMQEKTDLINMSSQNASAIDVVFPVLHGSYGEDGTIQGFFKTLGIPFVGAGVLGSAVGMDKDVMKRLLREAGLPVGKFIVLSHKDKATHSYDYFVERLGTPFFVKPANTGSSVGVSKVKNSEDFSQALDTAFLYDRKIIIEAFIQGREIECSVLGNEHPIASVPGEIIPQHEFYSYEAKYLDKDGALLQIPAVLDPKTVALVRKTAIEAFTVLCCEGMARVDFFLTPSGELFINEINTIPGFTKISMYPKLWQESGLSYPHLLDRLIELAIDRFHQERQILTVYEKLSETKD